MDIHGHIFLLSGWKTHFFSFHLRFPPYPVTTTIIWPTTDGIPHSLVFKSMQIKRIADNILAFFSFFFFYKLEQRIWRRENLSLNRVNFTIDDNKWKCTRAHVQEDKSIKLSIYISIRHFEVGWETGSRWLSKCIVGLLWGTNLPPCWKFVPQSSPTMHFETISTQSPAQPQSGQYENLFENGYTYM